MHMCVLSCHHTTLDIKFEPYEIEAMEIIQYAK